MKTNKILMAMGVLSLLMATSIVNATSLCDLYTKVEVTPNDIYEALADVSHIESQTPSREAVIEFARSRGMQVHVEQTRYDMEGTPSQLVWVLPAKKKETNYTNNMNGSDY